MARDLQPTPIGSRIRLARRDAGLTQDQLAERVGYSRRSVPGWERNETHPRPGALARIADVTGRPVSWFYEDEVAA